ncbi:hypothetical protein RHMOL_Rhmol08G0045000 [Rhododendron molle]|uniref:Uncharacterized protein n=1 Tax=Rhododendron molle TaxID=49168 RepID=A0ACC0MKD0_RHOML|nr:hypothetical protein RHMOL_Rhmol08G0045000 [Rhododendron molle]
MGFGGELGNGEDPVGGGNQLVSYGGDGVTPVVVARVVMEVLYSISNLIPIAADFRFVVVHCVKKLQVGVPCYIMNNDTRYVDEGSSSTSLSSQQDVDDRMIAVVLSEEYAKLDGAVGRRLSNLAPVAHIPRINTFIPNINDASLDHQRLLQRLNVYGLYEVKVSGDGNCQFRALSDQIYKSPEYHKHVRKDVVKQLKDYRSLYEGHVPMKYKRYYKKMAK